MKSGRLDPRDSPRMRGPIEVEPREIGESPSPSISLRKHAAYVNRRDLIHR